MARILFVWELGGGWGHCVKLAPLIRILAAQGHEVFFASRDVVTAGQIVASGRVKYLPTPCLMEGPPHPVREPRTFAQILHNSGFGDDHQLQSLVGHGVILLSWYGPPR